MKSGDGMQVVGGETPVGSSADGDAVFGSDAIALMLRELDIPYLAINPGSSFRGLHDSVVNHLGNVRPQLLLCLHEEAAVAIAHGYAKVAGRMMGAVVHSNVGLMHASMAIFNAWCDRSPVLVLGATGPVDAAQRRPWIDWIHTARDLGALVRDYTKWDDQPGSVAAAQESLLRAVQIARTAPCGPTYVCFDSSIQESRLEALPAGPDVARFRVPASAAPSASTVAEISALLSSAKSPVVLMGRVSRTELDWQARVRFAETLGARVLTDLKQGAAFPTRHPLHAGTPGFMSPSPAALEILRSADVIVSLDWVDVAGTLKLAYGKEPVTARIIVASPDAYSHRGWSADYQALPPVDVCSLCEPDAFVAAMLPALQARPPLEISPDAGRAPRLGSRLTIETAAHALLAAVDGIDVSYLRLPLGWDGAWCDFRHPLDYIGFDGGGGIGSGPGMVIGSALALKETSGRLPVALLGDGDFMMGANAFWTAAHYEIPMLVIVFNNRSFFNDELHQERVARMRGRPADNRWIGQRISGPDIDIAGVAKAQGAEVAGPVKAVAELLPILEHAITRVRAGALYVVDVWVDVGYGSDMSGDLRT